MATMEVKMSKLKKIGLLLAITGVVSGIAYAQVDETEPASTTTTVTTTSTPSGTVTERKTITTTAPAPKETIVTPAGYAYCFSVKAGWYINTWVAEHSVCQYPNSPEGVVWVEGYWECNQYDLTEGKCTSWDWKSAHWEKSFAVY